MYLIRNIQDVYGLKINILINNKKIVSILDDIQADKYIQNNPQCPIYKFRDLVYVSAGWIDIHTHCYEKSPIYYANPDSIGYELGSTLIIDAGSTGYLDIQDFYELQIKSKTNVKAFLNVSDLGLAQQNELSDNKYLNSENIKKALQMFPDFIVGFKLRLSSSVVGDSYLEPLIWFNQQREKNNWNLPLMVHVGNTPPLFSEIVSMLKPNDIITHVFHGKNDEIITNDYSPSVALQNAIAKDVNLDLGHGSDSFSYPLTEKLLLNYKKDILTTISSDIYEVNWKNKVVESLALTMSKLLNLNYSLADVITKVTKNPAKVLNLQEYGDIKENKTANLTFFTIEKNNRHVVDSNDFKFYLKQEIKPLGVVINGELYIKGELWDKIFIKN